MSIYVTKPDLPDFDAYIKMLKKIWDNKILTNNGPFHQEFEQKLKNHLKVKEISVYSNGTIALLAALKALDLKEGEIITTPYSFVATTHSIVWNGFKPVFADVDIKTGNLNPDQVEKLINDKTVAIMPVHVYGNPCDMVGFERLAKKYNLKIIYDAAHCFGVEKNSESILNKGDLSILSFHATKSFNSIEGGAVISKDKAINDKLNLLKNFGFKNETEIDAVGINGKMNELQAAFGLLQLKNIDRLIEKRKKLFEFYKFLLKNTKGIEFIEFDKTAKLNYSYFPIIVNKNYNLSRDELYDLLKENGIHARRYFYPLISDLKVYEDIKSGVLKNANFLSDRILCLPLYAELDKKSVNKICKLIC
jgi:dTDP-4-amino-4,6-dideoxygalactose transaminase